MPRVGRVLAIVVLLGAGGLAACGGDDAADEAVATTTTAPRERTLTVCGVEQEIDKIAIGNSRVGDFDGQAENALTYIDQIIVTRYRGRPPADIQADYSSVTRAYEVVREGFNTATTPDEYLAAVEQGALEAFGSREEVDRFLAAYTAWVVEHCGFDPELGIRLFSES